jgi:hypothetical protein
VGAGEREGVGAACRRAPTLPAGAVLGEGLPPPLGPSPPVVRAIRVPKGLGGLDEGTSWDWMYFAAPAPAPAPACCQKKASSAAPPSGSPRRCRSSGESGR